jgi:hypothetical protein
LSFLFPSLPSPSLPLPLSSSPLSCLPAILQGFFTLLNQQETQRGCLQISY